MKQRSYEVTRFIRNAQKQLEKVQDDDIAILDVANDISYHMKQTYATEFEDFLVNLLDVDVGIKICVLIEHAEETRANALSSSPMQDAVPGGMLCDTTESCLTAVQVDRYIEEKQKLDIDGLAMSIEEILSANVDSSNF